MLALIVAVAKNNVIGNAGGMPWHLPAELAYFKRITTGHPIIMGRKTFESIGRPLPNRRNIVVSRNTALLAPGCEVVASLPAALSLCVGQDVFVIGGATLYREALPHAQKLYLTEIDAEVPGDTHFPVIDPAHWHELSRETRTRDERNAFDIVFRVLERVGKTHTPA